MENSSSFADFDTSLKYIVIFLDIACLSVIIRKCFHERHLPLIVGKLCPALQWQIKKFLA
jgi:hypothetical protein